MLLISTYLAQSSIEGIGVFAAELSTRPVDRIGYRGAMLRFDIPLRMPREE